MIDQLFIFVVAMAMVIKGATMATENCVYLAESYRLSKYVVGFIVVAVISILPETVVSLNAALKGVPSFGLGTLLGSNVADLTLSFAIIVWIAKRGLKVESKILKNRPVYPFLLTLPLILGIDGSFTRAEGAALLVTGAIFYYIALVDGVDDTLPPHDGKGRKKHCYGLLMSMTILIIGAYFTVQSSVNIANYLQINPTLVGVLVVGLGTTIPELFFSLKSVKREDDSLAIGDLLGTVLADATVVIGILALASPFSFPVKIIYISGFFMVVAAFILFYFMHSGRYLSKNEASLLFVFWAMFVIVELLGNI